MELFQSDALVLFFCVFLQFNKAESEIDYITRKVDVECANLTDGTSNVSELYHFSCVHTKKVLYFQINHILSTNLQTCVL